MERTKVTLAFLFLFCASASAGVVRSHHPTPQVYRSSNPVALGGGGGICGGTISVAQSTGHYVGGTATPVTFNSAVAAGHTIIVGIAEYNSVVANIAVSDNKGNTYTRIRDKSTCNSKLSMWQSANITTGGSNFQITVTGDNTGRAVGAMEVEGTACAGTLDQNNNNSAASANWTTGNITTTAQDLVVAMATHDTGLSFNITPGGTWTQAFEDQDNANRQAISLIYKIVNTGTYNGDWVADESATYCAMIESFK